MIAAVVAGAALAMMDGSRPARPATGAAAGAAPGPAAPRQDAAPAAAAVEMGEAPERVEDPVEMADAPATDEGTAQEEAADETQEAHGSGAAAAQAGGIDAARAGQEEPAGTARAASEAPQAGGPPEDPASVLRGRVARALGGGARVSTVVLFGGEKTRADLIDIDGGRMKVRIFKFNNLETALPVESMDLAALAHAARPHVAPGDPEGIMALVQAFHEARQADAARAECARLAKTGAAALLDRALRLLASDPAQAQAPAAQPERAAVREAPRRAARPVSLWPESLSWASGARQIYASPDGRGPGTREAPAGLASVLSGGEAGPGAVVWLKGGVYRGAFLSRLSGSARSPVIVRACPGERVTLEGSGHGHVLQVKGRWTWYWGIEVTSKGSMNGLQLETPDNNYVNMVVHHNGEQGVGFWGNTTNSELYGSLIYANGRSPLAHGIYTQNNDPERPKRISDCIIFGNAGFGIHAYGEGGVQRGFVIEGNTIFDHPKDNVLVGGYKPASRIAVRDNCFYRPKPDVRNVCMGYKASGDEDLVFENNYVVGTTTFRKQWSSLAMTGNTFCGAVGGHVETARHPGNAYLDRPREDRTFIRPSRYEPGRANVTVLNWSARGSVSVDLGGVLPKGQAFEVRDARDFYGDPVLKGVYGGGAVALPMGGKDQTFGVFVVVPAAG